MRRVSVLAAVATMTLVSPVAAQFTAIGTTPGVETDWVHFSDADWVSQSFVSTGDYLTNLTFWFDGGVYKPGRGSGHFADFYLSRSDGVLWENRIYEAPLNQKVSGRYNIGFDYLEMVKGETYTFSIFANNCSGDEFDLDPCGRGEYAQFLSDERTQPPGVEYTLGDTYAGGMMYNRSFTAYPDRDLRFEATFVSVPEPGSLLLLATGLLGLAGVALRRRWA